MSGTAFDGGHVMSFELPVRRPRIQAAAHRAVSVVRALAESPLEDLPGGAPPTHFRT
jgi:hypothetical protein